MKAVSVAVPSSWCSNLIDAPGERVRQANRVGTSRAVMVRADAGPRRGFTRPMVPTASGPFSRAHARCRCRPRSTAPASSTVARSLLARPARSWCAPRSTCRQCRLLQPTFRLSHESAGGLATDWNAGRFLESDLSVLPAASCLVGSVSLFGNLEPCMPMDSCLQNVWAVPFWSVTPRDRNGRIR